MENREDVSSFMRKKSGKMRATKGKILGSRSADGEMASPGKLAEGSFNYWRKSDNCANVRDEGFPGDYGSYIICV